MQYSSCHPPWVSKGIYQRRSSENSETFEENIRNFRVRLRMRGYPRHLVDPLRSQIHRKRVGFTTWTKDAREATALCHPISPISASSEENINAKMALDREPTLTQGNIQGTPFHLLQKGEILKTYTCESKTLRVKVQHHHEN